MKKILSTRVLVKICVLTTILLVLIIYTIWGNSALMVSTVNISSDRIPSTFSNFQIAQVSDLHNAELPHTVQIIKTSSIVVNTPIFTNTLVERIFFIFSSLSST